MLFGFFRKQKRSSAMLINKYDLKIGQLSMNISLENIDMKSCFLKVSLKVWLMKIMDNKIIYVIGWRRISHPIKLTGYL